VKREGLGEAVRFIGYLDRADALPACYAAADVFVFASRTETQGLVLLEAMAAGLPVVALAEMGTVDILGPRRASLAPPPEPEAFGEAVGRLLGDAPARQRLAADAPAYAAEWSDTEMAARLAWLYRDCSNGTPRRHCRRRPGPERPHPNEPAACAARLAAQAWRPAWPPYTLW
jgi:glycosyltransferase involved in cell wall biosynthesis